MKKNSDYFGPKPLKKIDIYMYLHPRTHLSPFSSILKPKEGRRVGKVFRGRPSRFSLQAIQAIFNLQSKKKRYRRFIHLKPTTLTSCCRVAIFRVRHVLFFSFSFFFYQHAVSCVRVSKNLVLFCCRVGKRQSIMPVQMTYSMC